MQFDGTSTFTWTPTSAQANTSPEFYVQISDPLGNTTSIGPIDISVVVGLAPVPVPANSSKGGDVTVFFSGSQVEVYDNIGKKFLSDATFKPTDAVTLNLPSGQANSVLVLLPNSASAALPQELLIDGAPSSTKNQVIVYGSSGANTFTLAGATSTANGLVTKMIAVQRVTLVGRGGNDYYHLNSSSIASNSVIDTSGYNTADFSQDSGGVNVNLGLDQGQAQAIAPWGGTLSIYGVISRLIGSAYADVLTGGPAATTMIRAGAGNATIIGGSGNNVLLGGGGNDTIIGGAGDNLLIAGAGQCSLYAKGAENLVFAGSTNYDSNDQALLNLLAEGPTFMYSYGFRRALASAAANPALLSSMFSFQDSGAADIIYGNGVNSIFVRGKNDTVVS
jgi:Ca2+-binding RTX toxin-like protein